MRLNAGLPVWHVSTSVQHPALGLVVKPSLAEPASIELLADVGGDREWWIYQNRVGHLRVPVTPDEAELLPAGCAIHDAGDAGPERPRSRWS